MKEKKRTYGGEGGDEGRRERRDGVVMDPEGAAKKLAEVAAVKGAVVLPVQFAVQQRVEKAGRFGEVSRGYCSRHFVVGSMLVEVIIAGNHT